MMFSNSISRPLAFSKIGDLFSTGFNRVDVSGVPSGSTRVIDAPKLEGGAGSKPGAGNQAYDQPFPVCQAYQARGETDLALETIHFQQAFNVEGQAKLIVITRQGDDTHIAQAWLVGFDELFDELFDGQTGLTQGVVQAQTHVIEIG